MQNKKRQIKLAVVKCVSSKAADIYQEIKSVLDKFNAWKSIVMIISDTTAVNTGKKNGVIINIQKGRAEMSFTFPQFVSCQHHVLDRMDFFIGSEAK